METKGYKDLKEHVGHKAMVTQIECGTKSSPVDGVFLLCSCGGTLLLVSEDDTFLDKSENAIDCIDEIVEMLYPGGDMDSEWEGADVCMNLANLLKDYGFGPHAKPQEQKECEHEVDHNSLRTADGAPDVVDVHCSKCGKSGSFTVPDAADVLWE